MSKAGITFMLMLKMIYSREHFSPSDYSGKNKNILN
jgi:hypothetical protein